MKVGLIGHSQLREFHIDSLNINHENIEVAKFWRSGARVSSILDTHVFENFISFHPDLVIIFLGGNDITYDCSPSQIEQSFKELINVINFEINPNLGIFILEIEKRYPNEYFVNEEKYKKVRRSLNKRMREVRNSNL